eukprot:589994-Amorphochlora_amoeboformis.AAC.1
MVVQDSSQARLGYDNDKGILKQFIQEISRNVLTSRTHWNLRESSGSVTWRDVTLYHGISGSPY